MKILVRLPNWLGDMVMSVGAVHQLYSLFAGAEVSLIAKKGLQDLLPFFPPAKHQFVFSKEEYGGLKGVWRFGKMMRSKELFDLYLSFPDSFSSALMGYAAGAKKRLGYKKEGREILLTHAYTKPKSLHRVEEYSALLQFFTGKKEGVPAVSMHHNFSKKNEIVVNINSEASSRRLTATKALEIIEAVRKTLPNKIILIGGPKEKTFVEDVLKGLKDTEGIKSIAGKTSLPELVEVLASASVVLTTDSGPAHLANALGTPTVVLFGAGNENNTSPYNKEGLGVLRLGRLSCEPCTENVCVQFGTPQCLELLDTLQIIEAVKQRLPHGT